MAKTKNPELEPNCIFAVNHGYGCFFEGPDDFSGNALMEKWRSAESKIKHASAGGVTRKKGLDFFRIMTESLKSQGFKKITVFSLEDELVLGKIETVMLSHRVF